jgi:hypothetical protein
MRVVMMVGRWLFGVKHETVRSADRQCGVQHDHSDGERSNTALRAVVVGASWLQLEDFSH